MTKPVKARDKTGGRVIHHERIAELDKRGEAEVFRLYLEHGSTTAMCSAIFEAHPEYPDAKAPGRAELYEWLHAAEGRWDRWQKVRELRGSAELDLMLDEALKTTPENASAQRIIVDTYKYRSGILNRGLGPATPQTQVNVQVQVGMAWLSALQQVEASK